VRADGGGLAMIGRIMASSDHRLWFPPSAFTVGVRACQSFRL